jgi:cbb3-type cytochrome oxidase maturation protein
MELLYFAIPIGLAVGAFFVIAFVWASATGQFDDLDGPAHRAIHPQRPTQCRTDECGRR